MTSQPPRSLDHQDTATVHHAEPQNHGRRTGPPGSFQKQSFLSQPRPRMNRDGLPVQPPSSRMRGSRWTLDVGEGNENNSFHLRVQACAKQIREPPGVRLREKPLGSWSEENARKMDNNIHVCDGL